MSTSPSIYRGKNTGNSHLNWEVFVTPSTPVVTDDFAPGENERPWPPISSTLISGANDAVLVDSFITLEQARARCARNTVREQVFPLRFISSIASTSRILYPNGVKSSFKCGIFPYYDGHCRDDLFACAFSQIDCCRRRSVQRRASTPR